MYDLVADIERYPEFLPLCEDLRVRSREPAPAGEILIADMTVGYKHIRETFTTRVELRPAEPRILVAYLDGPFRRLDNRWSFLPNGAGCDVDFFIDYEFKSPILGLLVGAVFDAAFRKFAEAFEDRARVVYGAPRLTVSL
jgi:coenzyme Q-binding protein COQ10